MQIRPFVVVFLVAIVVFVSFLYFSNDVAQKERIVNISIGGETIHAIVADTPALRERGLSGRESLAAGEAMLFLFPEDGRHSFWMKDMLFSIDIIWISSSSTIVDIRESVSPESYPTVFTPRAEARYVVELPQSFTASHNLRIGERVEFPAGL